MSEKSIRLCEIMELHRKRGNKMGFGRRKDVETERLETERNRDKDVERAKAKEQKEIDRLEKARLRSEENLAREKDKRELAERQLELYGRQIMEEVCAGKLVRFYEKGFVRVSGTILKNDAWFEKLMAISSSADVSKKTALGRTIMASATFGANLVLTPNKRGDIYLTITTDRNTHMIHSSPPTKSDLQAMHKIANAGAALINSLSNQPVNSQASFEESPRLSVTSQSSLLDELTKLVSLRDAGALSEEEFLMMKQQLMPESNSGLLPNSNVRGEVSVDSVAPNNQQSIVLYDVELIDARHNEAAAIVVIRNYTNLELDAVKRIVDLAPSIVGQYLDEETALQFINDLSAVGAVAELRH